MVFVFSVIERIIWIAIGQLKVNYCAALSVIQITSNNIYHCKV